MGQGRNLAAAVALALTVSVGIGCGSGAAAHNDSASGEPDCSTRMLHGVPIASKETLPTINQEQCASADVVARFLTNTDPSRCGELVYPNLKGDCERFTLESDGEPEASIVGLYPRGPHTILVGIAYAEGTSTNYEVWHVQGRYLIKGAS